MFKNLKKNIEEHKVKIGVVAIIAALGAGSAYMGKDFWRDLLETKAGSQAVQSSKTIDENGNEIVVDIPRDASKFKNSDTCREYIPWGTHEYSDKAVKDRSLWLCKTTFAMQYDPIAKYPLWISEIINKKNLVPFNVPKSLTLRDDETIPLNMQPKPETFAKLPEGYKVGLLAPIHNRYLNMNSLKADKLNQVNYQSLKESFFTTNAYPVANNAKIIIDQIDQNMRKFAEEKFEVFIISGLVFLNGQTLGKVQNGDDTVLIPTHIYKIVTYPHTHASISYIIPNTNNLPCGTKCSPEQFTVPMQEVERVTGIEFYTKLAPFYAVQVKKDLNQIFKDAVKPK